MDDYEVDLRDYFHVLWKQKWIVILTFLVAVVTALGISYASPKTYQTETSLLILPPLATEVGGEVTGTVFSPETYNRLALSGDLLEEVIDDVYLDGGGTSVSTLRSRMKVEVEQSTAKDFPGRFPLYLRVTLTGTDPEGLPLLAETWARHFIERNTQLFLSRTAQSYDYVKENFDEVEQNLLAKEEEQKLYRQANPEPVIQAEVTALQRVYESCSSELANKRQQLANAETRLSALRDVLAREPEYFTLERGLSREALWNFLSAEISQEELASLPALNVQEQVLNSTYVFIRRDIAATDAEVQGLRGEVAYLESSVAETRKAFEEKQVQLVEVEANLDRLNRGIQVLDDAYTSLATKLQEARIARVEAPDPIRIVESPIVPSHSIAPNKKMNVAVAGVLGLFGGILLAFFAHYLQSGDTEEQAKKSSQPLDGEESDEVS